MRESKQDQFRIGGVYHDAGGRVLRLSDADSYGVACEPGVAWCQVFEKRSWVGDGYRELSTGNDQSGFRIDGHYRHLLPGELHQVDGKWVALGVEKPERTHAEVIKVALQQLADDLNADMIARDGPAKPGLSCAFRCGWPNDCCATKPAEPTAKPAISGLQREYSSTHLLGSYR